MKLNNNGFDRVPFECLAFLKNLEQLDFSGNNISEVIPYPQLKFDREMTLDLSNNRISNLRDGAFGNFRRLKRLDLSYNELTTVKAAAVAEVEELETLKLSFNKITSLDTHFFQKLSGSVKKLELEENRLPAVPMALYYLHKLEHLNLKSNKITTLESQLFSNFKPHLKELLLSFNYLERVPTETLEEMHQLIHLDLSRNKIKQLHKLAFGKFNVAGNNLVKLNLAGNLLTHLEEAEAFIYMSGVAYLDLSYNQIEWVSQNVFHLLSGLETLFLQNNKLRHIPIGALTVSLLQDYILV